MQLFLYNIFLALYGAGIRIFSLFNEKAGKWVAGRKGLLAKIEAALKPNEKRVWVHCSSVGEFEQARPLIEGIKAKHPEYKIVVTFFSPSGYELRKDYEHADYVFYLPMDGRGNAKQFIQLVQPSLAIFVKYEFWYHYLHTLKKNNIPTILVAAAFRPSQAFFKWHGGLFRKMLRCFTWLFVHDEASAKLLASIGFSQQVVVAGDTRYDRVYEIAQAAKRFPLVEQFKGNNKLFIAGSTWPDDERLIKDCMPVFPPGWKMILAPHELNKAHLQHMKTLFGDDAVFYSELKDGVPANQQVLIIDNMGMLSSIYRYGEIAYVGGGFLKGGIHNTLEPAVFGLPVVFGPVHEKFVEAVELTERGYGFPVKDTAACRAILTDLLVNDSKLAALQDRIRQYIKEKTGASVAIMAKISSILSHTH